MVVACEYPDCREIATMAVVVELGRPIGRRPITVPVCSVHVKQAQEIARLYGGIAYRLRVSPARGTGGSRDRIGRS